MVGALATVYFSVVHTRIFCDRLMLPCNLTGIIKNDQQYDDNHLMFQQDDAPLHYDLIFHGTGLEEVSVLNGLYGHGLQICRHLISFCRDT